MKKNIGIVLAMILSISILTACTRPESTKQISETTVPVNDIETMYIEDTIPADSNPTQAVPQDSAEAQNTDFYSVCTSYSKSEVEQFAKEVRELILDGDWENLSEYVVYPITMAGITYEDRTSFLTAPFETQLDADAIESIRSESCTDMFCNYAGIMMGNGEVWMAEVLNEDMTSAGLKVTALHVFVD